MGPVLDVRIEDGRVAHVGPAGRTAVDAGDAACVLMPPLADFQINGLNGVDLQSPDLTEEGVLAIAEGLAALGVAYWAPTLVTGAAEVVARNCGMIAAARRRFPLVSASVAGIHLEGPHISPVDGPRGAHPLAHVCPPDLKLFDRLQRAAAGAILYVTLAPELPGALAYIRGLVKRGVAVSLGHHDATAAQITAAVDAGARLCTHLGNGAAPRMARHLNPIWPQLAEDRLCASLIADGHHLPDPVLKSMVRAKGLRRIMLVSDCVHLTGLKPGPYDMFGAAVDLLPSGKVCLRGTELLAGSAAPLFHDVARAVAVAGLSYAQAVAAATTTPLRIMGLRRRFARPRVCQRADVLVLRPGVRADASDARLEAVYIHGARYR